MHKRVNQPKGKLNIRVYLQKHAHKQESFDMTVSGKNVLYSQTTSQGLHGVTEESETGGEEQHSGTDFRL